MIQVLLEEAPQPITKNPLIPGDFFHDLNLMSGVMLKKKSSTKAWFQAQLGVRKALKSSTLSITELCRATRNYQVPRRITCFCFFWFHKNPLKKSTRINTHFMTKKNAFWRILHVALNGSPISLLCFYFVSSRSQKIGGLYHIIYSIKGGHLGVSPKKDHLHAQKRQNHHQPKKNIQSCFCCKRDSNYTRWKAISRQ